MNPPHRALRCERLVACGAVALGLYACADDTRSTPEPGPAPTLVLQSLTGAAAAGWQRGDDTRCIELGRDPEGTVIAEVRIDGEWLLRPFGNCQRRERCGFVEIDVASEGTVLLTRSAASLTINLPLRDLAEPTGSFTFTARLVDQTGRVYTLEDGGTACVADEGCSVSLDVAASCGESATDASTADAALPTPMSDASSLPDAISVNPASDGNVVTPAQDAAISDASTVEAGATLDGSTGATLTPDGSLADADTSG